MNQFGHEFSYLSDHVFIYPSMICLSDDLLDINPIVVGLFDSPILVGGKKAPPPNSLLVIDRATKFGVLIASGMYFL